MTKTISERIAEIESFIIDLWYDEKDYESKLKLRNLAGKALSVIHEIGHKPKAYLKAENEALLAKNKKLNEKYSVESALNVVAELQIEDLKAKVKELEANNEKLKKGLDGQLMKEAIEEIRLCHKTIESMKKDRSELENNYVKNKEKLVIAKDYVRAMGNSFILQQIREE